MRALILSRIEEIKKTQGADLFTDKRTRSGALKGGPCVKYHASDDWSRFDDAELLRQFELLVMFAYRQR